MRWKPPPTHRQLALDLHSESKPQRVLASREIHRRVRQAVHARGPLGQDVRPLLLADLRADLSASVCLAVVRWRHLRRRGSRILIQLNDPGAIPALDEALSRETRPSVQRRLEEAIMRLKEAA